MRLFVLTLCLPFFSAGQTGHTGVVRKTGTLRMPGKNRQQFSYALRLPDCSGKQEKK